MTDDEFARQAREKAIEWIGSNLVPMESLVQLLIDFGRTTASAAWVEGWKAGQEAMRERAAKVCEEDVHNQHPAKPAGVVMSRYPASKPHAYLIRALQPLPPKKEIG